MNSTLVNILLIVSFVWMNVRKDHGSSESGSRKARSAGEFCALPKRGIHVASNYD